VRHTKQLLVAVIMMMPVVASAQLGHTASIATKVPFDFVVANRVVPAGKCVLQAANAADTILIRNDDSMVRLFSSTSVAETSSARERPTGLPQVREPVLPCSRSITGQPCNV
jgi:hypothetical protein